MNLKSTVRFTLETSLFRQYVNRDVCDIAELPRKMILSNDSYSFRSLGLRLQALRDFCRATACTGRCRFYADKKMYETCLNRIVEIYDIDHPVEPRLFNDKEFKFILATNDELIYPQEVVDVLGIRQNNLSFSAVTSHAVPVYIERFDGFNATCRNLTDQDIVVDTNLNQIWPIDRNRPPVEIIKLLKKTTERVH